MKSKVGWGKALKTTAPVAKVIELSLSDSVDEWGNMFDWFTDIQRYTFRFSFSYPSTMQDLASFIVLNRKIISVAFVSTCLLILGFFPETSPSCTTLEGDDDGSDLEIMPEQTSASNPLHESFRTEPQRLWCFFLFCASSMNLCHHTSVTRATWVPWGLLILFHRSLQHLLLRQSWRLQRGKPKQNKRRGMKYGKVDCNSLVFV